MLCEVTRELGFCLIYKNASSSVRAARPMRPVTPAEFLALPRRVALLREPHDRFESTWRDYRQRRDVRLTFGEFAETALAGRFPFKTPELAAAGRLLRLREPSHPLGLRRARRGAGRRRAARQPDGA